MNKKYIIEGDSKITQLKCLSCVLSTLTAQKFFKNVNENIGVRSILKKMGPIILLREIAHQTQFFTKSNGTSCSSRFQDFLY